MRDEVSRLSQPPAQDVRSAIDALYRQCAASKGKDGPLNTFLMFGESVRNAIRLSPSWERFEFERYLMQILARLGLLATGRPASEEATPSPTARTVTAEATRTTSSPRERLRLSATSRVMARGR